MKTEEQNKPIRILFAEDHQGIIDSFTLYLQVSKDFKIIRTVRTVREVLEQLQMTDYDVIILDLHLPQNRLTENSQLTGYDILEYIKENNISIIPIILSGSEEPSYISKAKSKGAMGYLSKKVEGMEFREAIRTVAWGKKEYIEKNLLNKINLKDDSEPITLTQRERSILKYIADGLTSREIGSMLNLAIDTIRDYRDSLIKKFGAKNAANLIKIATEKGYLTQT
jgi:DNA-binding NarL/FixJ family response regulator